MGGGGKWCVSLRVADDADEQPDAAMTGARGSLEQRLDAALFDQLRVVPSAGKDIAGIQKATEQTLCKESDEMPESPSAECEHSKKSKAPPEQSLDALSSPVDRIFRS